MEMYPVFIVDVCFDPYGTDEKLIGAESREDLLSKLDKVNILNEYEEDLPKIIKHLKEDEWRIKEHKHLFTDKPYVLLETFAYYE